MNSKIEIRKFLGMEVRVIDGTHMVLKDMFSALGRLRNDGQLEGNDTKKLSRFLNDIDKECGLKSFHITSKSKKSKSRETQELNCIDITIVPIVLTQFRPTSAKGEEALNMWREFMKFVNNLLVSLEVYNFIIIDKEKQKEHIGRIERYGGKAVVTNQQVNIIMAKLLGVYKEDDRRPVKKDELKGFQNQTTIDLLEAREFVLDKFANAYEFTRSHKIAGEMAMKLAFEKYGYIIEE